VLYREVGDFKTTYRADQQTFAIRSERILFWSFLLAAFLVVPFFINDYWEKSVLVPFLVWSMAALGLNILTGYCGQLSLGTGGFMAVGAYAAYKLMTGFPELNILIVIVLSGGVTAMVGVIFGLPSLRIKGFYLAVATLAAQFFLVWVFNKFPWFYNYSASGQITAPERTILGVAVTGPSSPPWATYLICLTIVVFFAFVARNLARGRIGRSWMAIRDMDIAAEIIGVEPLKAKLSAFAVSSFYVGIAGAMYFTIYRRAGVDLRVLRRRRLFNALAGAVKEHHGRTVRLGDRSCGAFRDHACRCPDHFLPDRGTARAGPALADCEGKAASLAISALDWPGRYQPAPAKRGAIVQKKGRTT
jgi:branched-chain amino acid transport system permease protein